MKQITVCDKAAAVIEHLRNTANGSMEGEYEELLQAITGLNDILCAGRGCEKVAFYANDAQRALDKILDYFDLLKLINYNFDPLEDRKVERVAIINEIEKDERN